MFVLSHIHPVNQHFITHVVDSVNPFLCMNTWTHAIVSGTS